MQPASIGDLATHFRNRVHNTTLKENLNRLTVEMSSGVTTDLRGATRGDLGNYAGLENALTTLAAYQIGGHEAGLFAETLHRGLEYVQDVTTKLAPGLLLAANTHEATLIQTAADDARSKFEGVVSALNSQIADRYLLAGNETGTRPLADVDTMLAGLQTAVAAATDAAGVEAAFDSWFDTSGGGFETIGYLGGTTDLAPMRIGTNDVVAMELRADDPEIRDLLKGYALAALVSDGVLAGQLDDRVALIESAGARLLSSDKDLAEIRARLGGAEARIETVRIRNAAEISALELARNKIVAVDPYRTATELQSAQAQIETLYTLTARLSNLNLSSFLR